MEQEFSYTADATSNIAERFGTTLDKSSLSIGTSREDRIKRVQKRIDDLKSRGLLNKQKYVSMSTSDFERIYKRQQILISTTILINKVHPIAELVIPQFCTQPLEQIFH